jgi:hypothetical protein
MFPRILFGFGGKLSNIPLIFEGVPPRTLFNLGENYPVLPKPPGRSSPRFSLTLGENYLAKAKGVDSLKTAFSRFGGKFIGSPAGEHSLPDSLRSKGIFFECSIRDCRLPAARRTNEHALHRDRPGPLKFQLLRVSRRRSVMIFRLLPSERRTDVRSACSRDFASSRRKQANEAMHWAWRRRALHELLVTVRPAVDLRAPQSR